MEKLILMIGFVLFLLANLLVGLYKVEMLNNEGLCPG